MLFQDNYMQNHFHAMDNLNHIYYAFAHLTFSTNPSFVDGSVEPSNLQHATSQNLDLISIHYRVVVAKKLPSNQIIGSHKKCKL